MSLVDNKVIFFSDGEAVDYNDLNKIVDGGTSRAWEIPGFADLLAHAPASGNTYSTTFSGDSAIANTVFCKGGGPELSFSGLTLTIGGGFMGTSGGNAPTILVPDLKWIFVNPASTVAITAAPSGQKRYDLISLAIAENTGDNESRDFEDAVTGAKSSTSLPKRKRQIGTITVTQGTPGGSPSVPAAGSLRVLALVLVNDTAIENVWDCMQPFGPARTSLTVPSRDMINVNTWAPSNSLGAIESTGVAACYLTPPDGAGDPSAKLLGIEIKYILTAAFSVKMVKWEVGQSTGTVIDDLTSSFTSGALSTTRIDLRGSPIFAAANKGPYWMHGETRKRGSYLGSGTGTTLALRIDSGATANGVFGVKWFWAKG